MLRVYMRVTLMLTLLFVFCGVGLIAFGSIQPINPALRGFVEGCEGVETLCWYGIVQGQTYTQTIHDILTREGYVRVSHQLFDDTAPSQYLDGYYRESRDGCQWVRIGYPAEIGNPNEISVYSAEVANLSGISLNLYECHGIYVTDIVEIFGTPQFIVFPGVDRTISFENGMYASFSGDLEHYASVRAILTGSGGSGQILYWQGFLPWWKYCLPITIGECLPY